MYWRTLPPEFQPILYTTGFWVAALLLGILFPFITDLATTVIVVSVLVVPVGMIFYVRCLFSIAANSSVAMADEIRNNTMQLLMSTPMSLDQIFLGKVAASIWRKMDDLILIVYGASIFGPPLVIMHYAGLFPLRESGIITYVLIIAMSLVSILRLILEPVMLGMMGVGIGAFHPLPQHRRDFVGGFRCLLLPAADYAAAVESGFPDGGAGRGRGGLRVDGRERRICKWGWRWG